MPLAGRSLPRVKGFLFRRFLPAQTRFPQNALKRAKPRPERAAPSSTAGKASAKRVKTRKTPAKTRRTAKTGPEYRPEFCARLLAFFDVPPFKVTEVQKKDGSITLLETASELPTFAAFARSLGVTQSTLMAWEAKHADFAEAAKKARDLQGDILIQNSLRGNYSASFAVFTAKNILGWSDGKDEPKQPPRPLVVRWEKE